MLDRLRAHWPEYLMEGAELAVFMAAACLAVALLEHPASPLAAVLPDAAARRVLAGLAMGATAVSIVYSPWGKRSGAHFNPAVTLAFLRLGKVDPRDAGFYVVAHFVGATLGVLGAAWLAREWVAHPTVDFVATRPGAAGVAIAFLAEAAISFVMMTAVLAVSNRARLAPYTGWFAGALVATFISLEAPLSGMSMNPARSFGPALVAGRFDSLWIYFAAPLLGMGLAAELRRRRLGLSASHCAKLVHARAHRCIFCGFPGRPGASDEGGDGREDQAGHEGREGHESREGHEGARRTRPKRARAAAVVAGLAVFGATLGPLAVEAPRALAETAAALRVGAIAMTVADADRSAEFYEQVLHFEKVGDVEVLGPPYEELQSLFALRMRVVRLRLGEETIELVEYLTPRGRPIPVDSRSNDRWFQHVAIIVSDMDRAYAHLREHDVRHASPAPQTLPLSNPDAGGIRAFYFFDPDGHPLEILEFPPDKGAARWQHDDALFLGIDHTAIVVADTDASLRFYRDGLGLEVAGESENRGLEQAYLNAVRGAHLRITGLRAAAGPGIELLEYRSPGDGRPIPADARPNDLAHWQTTLESDSPGAVASTLRERSFALSSAGVVELPDAALGFDRAFLARDPDGHAVAVVRRAP